jgi:hypothetical protein
MLLHTLRRSHTLARLVLVWFVLAMGVAIAAPAVQPLGMGDICSASAVAQGQQPETGGAGSHHTLQCVLCLSAGAPPLVTPASLSFASPSESVVSEAPAVVALAARKSPLAARAPPTL